MPLIRRAGTTGTRLALIDGDIIQYQVSSVCEGTYYFHPDEPHLEFKYKRDAKAWCDENDKKPNDVQSGTHPEEPASAINTVEAMIHTMMDNAGCSEARVFLTGQNNYRETLATIAPYKGHRSKDKPSLFGVVGDHLKEKFGAETIDGAEADDAMGYVQWASICEDLKIDVEDTMTNGAYNTLDPKDLRTVICTTDKDLNMIPGLHYNWRTGDLTNVQPYDADRFFYTQLLTGDTTDNIQGLRGCGPVTARRVLEDAQAASGQGHPNVLFDWYLAATKMYTDTDQGGYDALCETADLLWIQRVPNQFWIPPYDYRLEKDE